MFRITLAVSMVALLSLAFGHRSPAADPAKKQPSAKAPKDIPIESLLERPSRRTVASVCGTPAVLGYWVPPHRLEIDLLHEEIGLDPTIPAIDPKLDLERDIKIEAPSVDVGPLGVSGADGTPLLSLYGAYEILGQLLDLQFLPSRSIGDFGLGAISGFDSGSGVRSNPAFAGRSGAAKEKLLRVGGGNDETETAVARALIWIAKQQNTSTGFWEFDGTAKNDRIAATGMCLLPFLAAGETHKSGKKYKDTVARGLNYLKAQIKPSGQFGSAGMYSQAISTMALCEAAGMTRDDSIKKVARLAVDYIVAAQHDDGSWGYTAGTAGDTSIVGWQMQALKSARLADIPVPQKTFDNAVKFLESVSSDEGATYGYRTKGSNRNLTAVGLLCRQYNGWRPRNPSLKKGAEWLVEKYPPSEKEYDLYFLYYATQVMHVVEGDVWHKTWNPAVSKLLFENQVTPKTAEAKDAIIGSFHKDSGHIGTYCGKLGTTALACLTLEVYYRHLPLYKRDNGPFAENEK